MNPDWRAFLTARGARIGADDRVEPAPPTPQPTSGPAAPADCTRCDLSTLGLIAVGGPEASTFLQGQVTNDVRLLTAEHTQLSSHCSPKGRILALFRALAGPEGIWLLLPRERVAETLKRLRLFVLRAKVTLEDLSDGPVPIGLAGVGAPAALAQLGLPVPAQADGLATAGEVRVLRLADPVPRFILLGPVQDQAALWDGLAPGSVWGDADAWALADIRAGLPTVFNATAEAFVPQMLNLQLIDGVSFSKGCYVGQEIVARMQYLGRLKRRMYWAEVQTDRPPRPGDELQAPGSVSEQAGGRVVDARPSGPGRYELLVVAEIEAAEGGAVHLGPDGPRLHLAPPPYGLPAEGA